MDRRCANCSQWHGEGNEYNRCVSMSFLRKVPGDAQKGAIMTHKDFVCPYWILGDDHVLNDSATKNLVDILDREKQR